MPYVSLPKEEEFTPEARALYLEKLENNGRVTNMTATLLRSLKSFYAMEFYPVRNELVKVIGERATYFYCYAISSENDCLICTTYHARLLKHLNLKPEEFEYTEIEELLIAYGRGLVQNANQIDPKIFEGLKAHFTEDELVLITTVGCKMIASNLFNEALNIDLDEYLYEISLEDDVFTQLADK